MKKNKKAQIYFQLNMDGKAETVVISEEALRQYLKNAKVRLDKQEDVVLSFDMSGKPINISIKTSELNRILKQVMLANRQIIPHTLETYLVDVTQKLSQNPIVPIVKREREIEKIWFHLSQTMDNNAFLTGDIDVGKTALAYEIARQIATNECPKEFYEKHVIQLKPELLFQTRSPRAYERVTKRLMNFFIKNRKNIVLYIDNAIYMKVDDYLIMMLYACIKKYHIPMIATVNIEDYERYFVEDTHIAKHLNEVYVQEPEVNELEEIVKSHIALLEKKYKVKFTAEAIKFGIYTASFSESPSAEPGNVIKIFKKAAREARRKEKREVDKQCILSCYNTYYKIYEKMSVESIKAIAYHETGHYIVQSKTENQKDTKTACVSILPMVDWMGVNIPYKDGQDFGLYSKEYYLDEIAIYLAGRVAEKKVTNAESSGASSDLEGVSAYAKAIVMNWGFSEKDGNRNRCYSYGDYYLMPESKKELIDQEIQELIDAGLKRAQGIIDANEGLLKVIAERLMVDEILTGEELEQICKEYEESQESKK